MKKLSYLALSIVLTLIAEASPTYPSQTVNAATQNIITRSQVEQRALNMVSLTWTYSSSKNGTLSSKYAPYVTQPKQLSTVTTAQSTGIPYDWGGLDSLGSRSYAAPWADFLDAVNKGAYIGNVNTKAGYGYIPGTAGLDCSGFVQASYNITASKLSTSTLFNTYFTKISMSDIKHMDILDKPGDHVAIFDKWGTLNGIYGAYTYEATPDQTYGGIQGTKKYFLPMKVINTGYIPGRYINILEDAPASVTNAPLPAVVTVSIPAPVPSPVLKPAPAQTTAAPALQATTVPKPVNSGVFAQISNISVAANFRAKPSETASILGTVPKGTILYMINYTSGWYQIQYNGQIGWVWGNLISSIPSGKYVTINSVSMLNIRSNPTATASIVGTITQNQYAQVIDYSADGKWYKISLNGVQGWANSSYLKYIY